MKKRILLVIVRLLLALNGCNRASKTVFESDAERFQFEYMSQNGKWDDSWNKIRALDISKDNPMVYASFPQIAEKIERGESFVVYFGYAKCPWCRSCLTALLESANNHGITQILYVDISDSRDTYVLKNGIAIKTIEGAQGYAELLELLEPVLDDYVLQENGEEIPVGEKRIYAPNVIAVRDGAPIAIAADSALLTDPYGEITAQIYDDQIKCFDAVFDQFIA